MVASLSQKGGATGISSFEYVVVILSLIVGSVFCIWLGDQITVKGFGNGTSILIFVNIVSRLPKVINSLVTLQQGNTVTVVELALFFAGVVALLALAIYFSLAERKIPVQYAGKAVGNKVMRGNQHIYHLVL